jgi:hypothetical protein
MRHAARTLPLLLLLGGCKKVEPAPKELDALMHWMWSRYDDGLDEELAEGGENLWGAVDGDGWTESWDGSLTALTKDEAAAVGVTDRDPADAPGVFLVNVYTCSLGQLEPILLHKAQDELYEGVYDRYDRAYSTSREDFEARAALTMGWEVSYDASLFGTSYTAEIDGGLRAVPEVEVSAHGEFLMARTVLPEPAEFEGGNRSQPQDYQLEIWQSRGDGTLLHVYGLWRQADFGSGITSESEGSQRILLNNLKQ